MTQGGQGALQERGLGGSATAQIQVCLQEAQWDITMMPRESGAGIAASELPEAQPCSQDKLDLRARSPPSTHLPSKFFVSLQPQGPLPQPCGRENIRFSLLAVHEA